MRGIRHDDRIQPHNPANRLVVLAWCTVIGVSVAATAGAQGVVNPVLARAESLAARGDSAGARIVVDSVLADTDPTAPVYPGALFWRGALASSPSDARKDLLRLIVDYPFSEWVGGALYRVAQREIAAGDQANARRHLTRLVRDHAGSGYGSAGAFQLGKLLMADGEVLAACVALDSALAHEPAGNVELRNQISYVQRPCGRARANAASAERAADSSVARRDTSPQRGDAAGGASGRGTSGRGAPSGGPPPSGARPPTSSVRADSGARRSETRAGQWSVQVAAFAARADATELAARLKSRGYDSRVVDGRPYRVRIGRFATRAEATALVAKLRGENTTAIIVETERP